ncbi:type VII secretion protein EccCb [Streptomyces kunmingensis]|uniref:Type VII secretion protein EccCb n=1 Tax=Streptomyces kunmingensis TaxID=68225 RepID=A0ABU6C5F7_9ACTN|nr:type VII secretion protein EccCb [Streptomyces kunmingensis]MEB3959847.1 type VII secretion protein EccCb [Streptomyces kunmingensis]
MAGRRVALLVATDGYQDPGLNQLRAPARGATDLQALLRDPAVGRFDEVQTLLNRPKEEIEGAIEGLLSDRAPDDFVLLYLACHGIRNDGDRLFFATLGTRLNRPATTAMSSEFLHGLLDESQAGTKVVLLDCCYSGLFHRGTPMSPAPVDVESAVAGRGTFVITATTALEYAYEGDQLKIDNGISAPRFTNAVIEGLSTGLADLNRDGVITPDELYTYVHEAVRNQTGPDQTPTKSGHCEGGVALAYAPGQDVTAGRAGRAAAAHELPLGTLLPPPVETADRGYTCDAWEGSAQLRTPVGRLEHSADGELMCVDFSGREGNAAVVGKLGSGKTTLLRSLVLSLALTHTPGEVEFVLLEGAVNRLGVLRMLPHVRGVAAPHEETRVGQALDEVREAIAARRSLFRDHDIDSIEAFRALRAEGALGTVDTSDLFLVVDGWLDFCWERAAFADEVHRLANTGLNYGVHLCVTARRWSDFTPELLGLLGTRVELALDHAGDSQVDPVLAASVGVGWALSRRRRFRVAVPRLDDITGDEAARRSLADTVERIRAGWRRDPSPGRSAPTWVSFTDLLKTGRPADWDPAEGWRDRLPADRLTTPFGTTPAGTPVLLDIKAAGEDGMGPHGLLVGAAGSGKSEFLRTLVLSYAATHAPHELNFLLVGDLGRGTFRSLAALPHTSAVPEIGSEDTPGVVRLAESVTGEIARRSALLSGTGQYGSHGGRRPADGRETPPEPLPALLVVVEDFTELIAASPDFMDTLISIGRVGRSVGVHMLLAARRLRDHSLRGLEPFLSYRIALRTASATESRAVLGVSDANRVPLDPGVGYLRTGSENLIRFKAAFASAPGPEEAEEDTTVLDAVVAQLARYGPASHPVWLPPLDVPPALDELLPPATVDPERGLQSHAWPGAGKLSVPLGLVDMPEQQLHAPAFLDFSGDRAHALFVGGPHSGKSTLVATLITSFALTHTAQEARFYVLDFDSDQLADLAGLPHVGQVARRREEELVRRTIAEVVEILAWRERECETRGVTSIGEYRERYAGPKDPASAWSDVFLVIDGYATLRTEYEHLERAILDIASRGRRFGIHLVLTASRYVQVRPSLREHLGHIVELRLGDPTESEIDRRSALRVPPGRPGHGLAPDGRHLLTALPRLQDSGDLPLPRATAALVDRVRAAWGDRPAAPPVRLLPAMLQPAALPAPADTPAGSLAVGIDGTAMAPVLLDFVRDPLLLVLGEAGSGKTSLLRFLARSIAEKYPAGEALIFVADFRRSLIGDLPESHVVGHCMSSGQLREAVTSVRETLEKRLPGPDVTPQQVRDRSWYTGPAIHLLIDDYDLVATASGNELLPLLDLLPYARDIGLRIVLTRTAAGASRALYDPFIQRLRELGDHGIILSGDPSEGMLLGQTRASSKPPGRGTLVSRKWTGEIQLAFSPSHFDGSGD